MNNNCKQCKEIIAFEQRLDVRAEALVRKAKEICRPVRERNNERWQKFAKLCHLPVIGNAIFDIFKIPRGLENEPKYSKEEWYQEEGRLIEEQARRLEEMKAADMEHWGDEDVTPMNAGDPAGYYTPSKAPRKECYARGFGAFPPLKYDFSSLAGVSKFETENLVLCSQTKKVVPATQCHWHIGVSTGWKPIYRLKEFTDRDPSICEYNEWRDDEYYQKHPGHRRQGV